MGGDDRLAARQHEYEQAEAYLRALGLPEVQWILRDDRLWWKVSQLAALLGLSDQAIRDLLKRGLATDEREGIPGGVLHSQQAGWKVARRGVVVYLARLQKSQRQAGGD